MEHFDDFYKTIFGASLWRSMRLGLLCNNKYCAVVNNYSDSKRVSKRLEVSDSTYFATLILSTFTQRRKDMYLLGYLCHIDLCTLQVYKFHCVFQG